MKILNLPAYFYPENMSSGHLDDDLYQAFAKAGMDVVVYTSTPTRGITPEVRTGYKKRKNEMMYDGRVSVHRFSLYDEGKNPVLRALRYVLQCLVQLNKGVLAREARTCNIIYVASTPPIKGAVAALIKKIRHIPFVYGLQDIFPDSLSGAGLAEKGGWLWKIGTWVANYAYKNADKIIVISEDFKQNLLSKGVPEEKIEVVYNWIDEDKVVPITKKENPLYEEFGLCRDKFNVVYAGNLGNAQNIDIIIDSAKELVEDEDIEFIIFGTGGLKERFVEKVKDYGLDNVKFLPLQPIDRVSYVYGIGDVCIVSCKPGFGGSALPSKTMTILSAGRPILASFDEGELTSILTENHCGVFAKAGDVGAFVALVKRLAANRAECEIMGRNGRNVILTKFTKDVGTSKYVEIIKEVIRCKV